MKRAMVGFLLIFLAIIAFSGMANAFAQCPSDFYLTEDKTIGQYKFNLEKSCDIVPKSALNFYVNDNRIFYLYMESYSKTLWIGGSYTWNIEVYKLVYNKGEYARVVELLSTVLLNQDEVQTVNISGYGTLTLEFTFPPGYDELFNGHIAAARAINVTLNKAKVDAVIKKPEEPIQTGTQPETSTTTETSPPTSTPKQTLQLPSSASANLQIGLVSYGAMQTSKGCILTDSTPYRVILAKESTVQDIKIPITGADTTKPIYVGIGTKSTIQPPTDKSISDFEANFGTGVNADSISWPEIFEDGLQFKLEPNAAIATLTVKGWNQSTPFKIYACQDKDNDGKCGSNKSTQGYIEPDDELASLTIQASGTLKPVEETSCAPPQEEKKPAGECTTILDCLAKIDQWIVQTLFK